jgi:hypothetical protein
LLLSGAAGIRIPDDQKLIFGADSDSHIYYRETGDDYLVISGSANGLVLSGTNVIIDGALQGASPLLIEGDVTHNGNLTQTTGDYVATDKVRAINGDGLALYDDGDNGGIFIKDGGNVGIGAWSGEESKMISQLNVSGSAVWRSHSDSAAGGPGILATRQRVSSAKLEDGDSLWYLRIRGSDGNDTLSSAAEFRIEVDNTVSENDLPGRFVWKTTPNGKSTPVERMRLNSSGSLNISGSTIFGRTGEGTSTQFSGSIHVADDLKLNFGATDDAHIYYRETGDDYLVISGSANGVVVSGSTVVVDAATLSVSDGNITNVGDIALNSISADNQAISIATTNAAGDIVIVSAHTAGTAIHLDGNANVGSVVDIDAGQLDIDADDWVKIDAADEIELTTTSADGHIKLASAHTAGVAIHLDGNANAGSIVDIDAGELDIDADGDAYITSIGNMNLSAGDHNLLLSGAMGVRVSNALYVGTSISGSSVEASVSLDGAAGTFQSLDISGDIDVDGTTNLDIVDIDGATNIAATLTIAPGTSGGEGIIVIHTDVDEEGIAVSSTNLTTGVDIVIDHNDSLTTTNDPTCFVIDFDKTGNLGSGVRGIYTGQSISMLDAGTNNASSQVYMTGSSIILSSSTPQGVQTAVGLEVFVTGSKGSMRDYAALFKSGFVGIGDSAPNQPLSVYGQRLGDFVAFFSNAAPGGDNANYHGIGIAGGANAGTGHTYYVTCYDSDFDGGDGGGANTPVGFISNNGGTFALTDPSDERLKENIRDASLNGIEIVGSIKVRDFELKKSGITKTGFVAQELKEVYSPAVVEPDGNVNDMMGVTRAQLIPVLVKAVQELSEKVKSLEEEISKK